MGVKHSMVSDNNAQFWYTSLSIKGWWRISRWTNKQMSKSSFISWFKEKRRRLYKRDTILPSVINEKQLSKGSDMVEWTCKRFWLTMTLSEAYYQEEEEEADDCDMTKPWKLNMQTFSIENKGAIAWKLDMQTFSIERTRALLQSITENASFKGSEIALL